MSITAKVTQKWVADASQFDDHEWLPDEMKPTDHPGNREFPRPAAPRQPQLDMEAHLHAQRQARTLLYAHDDATGPEPLSDPQDHADRISQSRNQFHAAALAPEPASVNSDWSSFAAEADDFHLRRVAEAAERGAILGTRRLDKVRAEWRDFTRRFETTALTATELRRLRADLRRREALLLLLGGFVLVMGVIYGALLFSSPQLLGNPRSEWGCVMFGGTWAETATSKEYCIFWAH